MNDERAPGQPLATGGRVAVDDDTMQVGTFGWREPPKGAILIYQLGRWYRCGGVEFSLVEPPQMVTGQPGHWVGSALLRDGRVTGITWGPTTRAVTWWERVTYALGWRKEPARKRAEEERAREETRAAVDRYIRRAP